jgi:tetratricopeptide (TPR) repeat protein
MNRITHRIGLVTLITLVILLATAPVFAKDSWVKLRSTNFVLVGNADQKKIRDIAIRLEQFRNVFTQLFPGMKYTSQVPTTIVVLKDLKAYAPFRPGGAAGHFQPGEDMNYVVLTTDPGLANDPYSVMFHEYTHLLVHNSSFSDVPTWFNEGLAEYYSTFNISDDRKVKIGLVIPSHMYVLRKEKLLPLATLLGVDHDSPYYNEGEKKSIFYAQAWLFVHYLIQNNNGTRLPQLARFLELLLNGTAAGEAFPQAFGVGFAEIEKDLQVYLKQDSHRITLATFEQKLETDREVAFEPVDDASALAYQGDLALHMRLKSTEEYLNQALKLDPNQPRALLAAGRLATMSGRPADAVPFLERAAAADPQNGYARYYYAEALMRQSQAEDPRSLTPEGIAKLRSNLNAAIKLEPSLTEAYRLYAYLSLLDRQQQPESIELLKRAILANPTNHELRFSLAQSYLGIGEIENAKTLFQALAKNGKTDELRQRSQGMLDQIVARQSYGDPAASGGSPRLVRRERVTESGNGSAGGEGGEIEAGTRGPVGPAGQRGSGLRPAQEGEVQVRGSLLKIDCTGGNAVVLIVKTNSGVLKLKSSDLGQIEFRSFTTEVAAGQSISCGDFAQPPLVLATYRPSTGPFAGEPLIIEFVPRDLPTP